MPTLLREACFANVTSQTKNYNLILFRCPSNAATYVIKTKIICFENLERKSLRERGGKVIGRKAKEKERHIQTERWGTVRIKDLDKLNLVKLASGGTVLGSRAGFHYWTSCLKKWNAIQKGTTSIIITKIIHLVLDEAGFEPTTLDRTFALVRKVYQIQGVPGICKSLPWNVVSILGLSHIFW